MAGHSYCMLNILNNIKNCKRNDKFKCFKEKHLLKAAFH